MGADRIKILSGHVVEQLALIPEASVQCVVTSPPYWQLRSYLPKDSPLKPLEIGSEKTPEEYVQTMLRVFGGKDNPTGTWRVLRGDGTVWLNLGDTYTGGGNGVSGSFAMHAIHGANKNEAARIGSRGISVKSKRIGRGQGRWGGGDVGAPGLKEKDLVGIPWRVALALQAAGWYLRSDIVWAKPNSMPESVTDRPTRAHEYLFLLSKSPRYFYDAEAIKEPCIYDVDGSGTSARKALAEGNKLEPTSKINGIRPGGYKNSANFSGKNAGYEKQRGHGRRHDGFNDRLDQMEKEEQCTGMRNKRDVWTVSPANYPEAHFATFPTELIKPCVLAGTSAHGCCPECGSPFRRIVELGGRNAEHQLVCGGDRNGEYHGESIKDHAAAGVQDASAVKARILAGLRERKTTGWEPTCRCAEKDSTGESGEIPISAGSAVSCKTVPCIVLDPFGGSGTTGQVALELGRRAILIELNPDYLPLIDRRLKSVTPGLPL